MALFGAPLALEDHAIRAAFAALRMQESVRAYAAQLPKTLGTVVSIRVGLNSGDVVVRSIASDLRVDYTAVGQTTHLASRMEQAATPGSILITPNTATLVGGYVVLEPLGPLRIKGLDAPMAVYEIVGAGQARSRLQVAAARGLTPFVGRTSQVQLLITALERARAAHGQLVCVGGEAGVGKSRLLWEFIHSEHTQDCLLLEGQAAPYTKGASYAPIIELLRKYFEIEERQDHEAIRVKVASRLQSRERSLQIFVPAFLALLDVPVHEPEWTELDPLLRRARTIEGVRRLMLSESARQPVVLALEDLHWADSETHAVLDAVIETLRNARILILTSYRPDYQDPWATRSFYTQLHLEPLSLDSVENLLTVMLGSDVALARLKAVVREQTAGNPLFLEESVRTLVETEALTGTRGAYRLSRPVSAVQIPPSVLSLIAARIDRLAERDKQLLQSAAVIGKDVPAALLVSVARLSSDDLRTGLGRLQAGEFLFERSLFPDLEYTFKHTLTHEVAYGSLLKDRRRALHGDIVDTITALYGDRLPEHVERLAHHAQQSERWMQAAEYCGQAGRKAMARSANREAVTYFDQALGALRNDPGGSLALDRAFDIRLDLRSALIPLGEFGRVFETLHDLESLAERLGDPRRQGLVAALMAGAYPNLGQSEQASIYGERARKIAAETGDTAIAILANTYLGASYYFLGQYQRSIECTRQVVALLPRERSHESFGVAIRPAVFARGFLCWSLSDQGHFDEAGEVAHEALELAEGVGHPQTVVAGLLALGTLYVRRGDVSQAIAPFERARELCHRHDVPLWKPIFASFLGYSLALSARFAEAEMLLREALEAAESMRLGSFHSQMILWLAEARLLMGDVADAAQLTDDALDSTRHKAEAGLEGWALRLAAEVVTRRAPLDVARAEDLYHQAMRQAERLGTHPLAARCHLDLGRLYGRAGKDQEAHHHLATAAVLFREMKMRLWSDRAEGELRRFPVVQP